MDLFWIGSRGEQPTFFVAVKIGSSQAVEIGYPGDCWKLKRSIAKSSIFAGLQIIYLENISIVTSLALP
jgi:hypothetical protein